MTQIDHRGYCDAGSGHDAMMIGMEAFHWWGWLGYWGNQAFHLAFIWQLSRINGGPNFYDSTLARPKVSITSEAETQGDKEHSSQHLQAGQCGSFCQCPVFARIYFLWQYFSVNDPVFANKTCQLCQLCHLQLKGLSPVCLRLCRVSSSERANLAKKRTRSITIIDLDDNHSGGDVVLNQNIELNCSNLALSDSQKPAWC